jgi:hypothetical protein
VRARSGGRAQGRARHAEHDRAYRDVLAAPGPLVEHTLAEEQQHEQSDRHRRLNHHERREQQRHHL